MGNGLQGEQVAGSGQPSNLQLSNFLTFNSLTNDQLVRSGNPPPENFQQGGKGLW
jgi:hypothetical protein